MRRRELLKGCGAFPLTFSLFPSIAGASEAIRAIEKQVPRWMQEAKVPGVSIAVIQDAKIAWRRGFGVKAADAKMPVTEDTMFEAASMSKPVFAYAVLKLCERGVLDLDTPLTKYTPDRFLKDDSRLELITARHVLTHRSGFQNWRSDKEPLKINFSPGEKFLYSGEGFNYLQTVVAHVTGEPIEVYMPKNMFKPFGMSSSGYVWNDDFEKRMARPHDKDGKPKDHRRSKPSDVARYGSAGALLTTPTDYARFLIEVIQPKPADAFRLKPASLQEMLQPHVKLEETNEYRIEWSLGWRLAHTKDGDYFGHGGDNPGFHCLSQASAKARSGIVVMTNADSGVNFLERLGKEVPRLLRS